MAANERDFTEWMESSGRQVQSRVLDKVLFHVLWPTVSLTLSVLRQWVSVRVRRDTSTGFGKHQAMSQDHPPVQCPRAVDQR